MFLSRQQILDAEPTLPSEVVAVPEWGGDVKVVGMSGAERDAFEDGRQKKDSSGKPKANLTNIRAALVAASLRDEAGKLLFTQADVMALGIKSAKALDRVASVAMRLNGMTQEDVEQLEKN